jgi:hypothetical protein
MPLYVINTKDTTSPFLRIDFIDYSTENQLETTLTETLKNLFINKDSDSIKYQIDSTKGTLFKEDIKEPNDLLQNFIQTIIRDKATTTQFSSNDEISNDLIFYHHNEKDNTYYLCIQQSKIFKKFEQVKKFLFRDDKFTEISTENILNINNYFDAVIKISNPTKNILPTIYFYTFSKKNTLLLCDILTLLGDRNPYQHNTKESILKAIETNPICTTFIHCNSLNNIEIDGQTKTRLNKFINYTEDELKQIIKYLIEYHKEKKYIVEDKIFFPKDKKEFKDLLKIISTKKYLWENSSTTSNNLDTKT